MLIRLHYVVWKPTSEMLLSIWLLWTTRPQCMGVACRGHWPLGTSSAQFTVYWYRLRHSLTNQDSCPTARTAARPIPKGMTIFCLPTASTSRIRTAWLYLYDWGQYGRPPVASAGLLVVFMARRKVHLHLQSFCSLSVCILLWQIRWSLLLSSVLWRARILRKWRKMPRRMMAYIPFARSIGKSVKIVWYRGLATLRLHQFRRLKLYSPVLCRKNYQSTRL